jgi:hypothetical protein
MLDGYMGSGKVIKRAIEKYGVNNFQKVILETFENSEAMYAREKEIVTEEFLSRDDVYNLRRGGLGGFEYINKTGKNLYGSNGQLGYGLENLEFGRNRIHTIEENLRLSKMMIKKYALGEITPGFLGKIHSEETKKIIGSKNSKSSMGEKNSQFGSKWIYSLEFKVSKKIKKEDPISIGWIEGRKIKF